MTIPETSEVFVNIMETKSLAVTTWCSSHWKGILSEFVSTTLLISFGCMSCIPIKGFSPHPVLYSPLGFGFVVMFNIQIFGHISGAYMNPFVAIIAIIWDRISVSVGIAYVLAEIIGAVVGYGFLVGIAPNDVINEGTCLTLPHSEINIYQALGIEILLSAALSLVNCAVWDPINKHNTDSIPIKFGLTIVGLSIVGGPLTGASMNPARSFGPALWTGNWDVHWVYWVGPLIGGIVPALFYKYIWLQKPNLKTVD